MSDRRVVLGVDAGGTRIKVAAVADDGTIVALDIVPTPSETAQGADHGFERLIQTADAVLADAEVTTPTAIGIGATGPVDRGRGVVNNPYTLPAWYGVPVRGRLAERYGVSVVMENDADAAALGEQWQGEGRGASSLLVVTVGTGIGTSLLVEGRPFRGAGGGHPEIGHHVVDVDGPLCYCGAHGCWEVLASGTAIARRAAEQQLALGPEVDAKVVAQAARRGVRDAQQIIDDVIQAFAVGLVNAIGFLLPERVVLTGGVIQAFDDLVDRCQAELDARASMLQHRPDIVVSTLLDTAGVFGAAYAAWQHARHQS